MINPKIHGCSWSQMCSRKKDGGLGFRDLHIFNQAMLAKQSWRIIRRPNKILAKVLRGKYFKIGNFLNASHKLSYAYQSILWGRALFKKGYRWKVGNGHLGFLERRDDKKIHGAPT